MSLFTIPGAVTITCHKRITPWLLQEVEALGFTTSGSFVTGVQLQGTINDCIKLNLQLRCASHGPAVLWTAPGGAARRSDTSFAAPDDVSWQPCRPRIMGYHSITDTRAP